MRNCRKLLSTGGFLLGLFVALVGWPQHAAATLISVDLQKHVNGLDSDDPSGADAPIIAPGDTVTWTYMVTNTGDTAIDFNNPTTDIYSIDLIDDNGTPGDTSDDFTPAFDTASDVGDDNILGLGEIWGYTASAIAEDLASGLYTNNATVFILLNGEEIASASDPATYRNPEIIEVPEPSTLGLFAFGLIGLGVLSRRRRKHAGA